MKKYLWMLSAAVVIGALRVNLVKSALVSQISAQSLWLVCFLEGEMIEKQIHYMQLSMFQSWSSSQATDISS